VSTEPVQILGCMKAPHRQMQPSRTEVIEQHIDSMLQEGDTETKTEADDMDLELSVKCIDDSTPDKAVLFYLGRYVAHKLQRFSSCLDCLQLLTVSTGTSESKPDAKLVELRSLGRLNLPSLGLTKLAEFLEQCVQNHAAKPCVDISGNILNEGLASDQLAVSTIGCSAHASTLTAQCVHFYIATRVFFLGRACNRNRGSNKQKHKLSKLSKVT